MVRQYQKQRSAGVELASASDDKLQLLEQIVNQLIIQVQRQEQEIRRLNSKVKSITFL